MRTANISIMPWTEHFAAICIIAEQSLRDGFRALALAQSIFFISACLNQSGDYFFTGAYGKAGTGGAACFGGATRVAGGGGAAGFVSFIVVLSADGAAAA